MNYTENLKLPQWSRSDRIRMEDFNEAMANIDKGYTTSPAVQPFVVGSYTADGDTQAIELGFRPSFLIISGVKQTTAAGLANQLRYFAITGKNEDMVRRVQITSFGFCTYLPKDDGVSYPNLCEAGRTYYYIAFR